MITAMDIDPARGDLWLTSYFHGFRLPCADRDEPIAAQLKRVGSAFELPRWKQIEGVAVDRQSSLWITTEGRPAKMGRLKLPASVIQPTR